MEKKLIVIILACIVLSSALGISGYLYLDLDKKHAKLQSDYEGLESDYAQLNQTHQILILEFNELNASYQILALNYTKLKQDHSELSENYTTLEQNYDALSDDYAVLNSRYTSLFSDYNALSEVFNQPLSHEEIPSTYELRQWLATDKTDEIGYSYPNFICGDFAVMLSQHSKLQHWDIGIVAVLGYTETHESYAHAFNAIITVEGLVYIEPQNDHVWWYGNHEAIQGGAWFEIDNKRIYVEDYVIVVLYD